MKWPTNATTRAVAEELIAANRVAHWQHQIVSWPLSEDCYFCVVLSPGNAPHGGVAMPRVAERMYEILRTIGSPPQAWPQDFRFQFLPLVTLPFGLLTGKNEEAVRLNDEVHLDAVGLAGIIDFVRSAMTKVREIAGTVDQALDLACNKMPWHPGSLYAVPVGYRIAGRHRDCENYLADCRVHLQRQNNPTFLKLYDQFADQLDMETW